MKHKRTLTEILFLICATLVALVPGGRNSLPDPTRVYSQTVGSTVLLTVSDPADTAAALGSGFYVSPHLLVTCAHVTEEMPRCRVLQEVSRVDSVVRGQLLFADSLRDVAVLYTDTAATPLRLRSDPLDIGETVFAIGNPQGYMGSLSAGVVSQFRDHPEEKRGLVQCTSLAEPGSSGGPVLDREGRVVGVISFGSDHGNYTFAVDAKTIQEVISKAGDAYNRSRIRATLGELNGDSVCAVPPLNQADISVLSGAGEGSPGALAAGRMLSLTEWAFVVALLLCLGAVLRRRHRRLRRNALRQAVRLQFEEIRSHAFLPDELLEAEIQRSG